MPLFSGICVFIKTGTDRFGGLCGRGLSVGTCHCNAKVSFFVDVRCSPASASVLIFVQYPMLCKTLGHVETFLRFSQLVCL